jgi:hypothetical protein
VTFAPTPRLEEILSYWDSQRLKRGEETDSVAGHIGLELANVALTWRDLNWSLTGVREKSLIRKCSVNPRSSAEITKKDISEFESYHPSHAVGLCGASRLGSA